MEFVYADRRQEGDTVLRQCQLAQLYILHVIDSICKEYGIVYFLDSGTLLGAIRHDGFIPWDDDLDIGMPRKDYEKFLKIAPRELPSGLFLHVPSDTPRSRIPFAKVRDRNSFYCECRPDIRTSDPSGIYVDIFPYDDMPRLPKFINKILVRACASAWKRARGFYDCCSCNFLRVVFAAVQALICQLIHLILFTLVRAMNVLLPGHDVVACLNEGFSFFYNRRMLFPAAQHVFEDAQFPVPRDADGILTAQYGDWRQVPPPESRPRHARIIDAFHSACDL